MLLPARGLAVGVINNYDYAMGMMPLAEDLVSIALGDEPRPGRHQSSGRNCPERSPIALAGTVTPASMPPVGIRSGSAA
jgi:hypothetical protein